MDNLIYLIVVKLFELLNNFALTSSILFFWTKSVSNPAWEVWDEFSSSIISSFFWPWILLKSSISFLAASSNNFNLLFSIDNLIKESFALIISSLSSCNNSNKGFIDSNFSFLYFSEDGFTSPKLPSLTKPSSIWLSMHLTIYKIWLSPNFILSKAKLNLYSLKEEFLLYKSMLSSNSVYFSSENNALYSFIKSWKIFSSFVWWDKRSCSFDILSFNSSKNSAFGVGVVIVSKNLYLPKLEYFLLFILLFLLLGVKSIFWIKGVFSWVSSVSDSNMIWLFLLLLFPLFFSSSLSSSDMKEFWYDNFFETFA